MTINTFIIPLTNEPQQFEINLDGIVYTLINKWNDQGQFWILDIADSNNNPLACGIPFVAGVDLLSGLEYLGIGGSLFAVNLSDPDAIPTLYDLGVNSNLYFQTVSP